MDRAEPHGLPACYGFFPGEAPTEAISKPLQKTTERSKEFLRLDGLGLCRAVTQKAEGTLVLLNSQSHRFLNIMERLSGFPRERFHAMCELTVFVSI